MWLRVRLGNRHVYWKLRSTLQRIVFVVRRSVFFWDSFWATFGPLILATATILVIALLVPATGVITKENAGSYDGVQIAVSAVIGVFLSLYFTAISTVVSTAYAKLPEPVRDLVVHERVNNLYVSYLIYVTIVALLLLAAGILFDSRPKASLYVIVFLSILAVFAFAQLGKRVFTFFNPTKLVDQVAADLDRWTYQATVSGYMWDTIAFQDYYRRQAKLSLGQLSMLVDIAHSEQHLRDKPMQMVMDLVVRLTCIYLFRREHIPTSSRWYEFVPQYRDWYLTSDDETGIHAATMTSLPPEMKPDPAWLERGLIGIVTNAFEKCLSEGRTETGAAILSDFGLLLDCAGRMGHIEQALTWIEQTRALVSTMLATSSLQNATAGPSSSLRNELGLLELQAQLPILLLLGFYNRLGQINIDAVMAKVAGLNGHNSDQIYRTGLPTVTLERLEDIEARLSFEREAENGLISPPWYLMQQILQPLAYWLRDEINALVSLTQSYYLDWALSATAVRQPILATVVIAQGLEYVNKSIAHVAIAEALSGALDKQHHEPKLGWPEWQWQRVHDDLDNARKSLVQRLAQCIPLLGQIEDLTGLPDYLGQAVHVTGEQCFLSLTGRDAEQFRRLFPYYFQGAFTIRNRLIRKTADWYHAPEIHSAPLLDLVELSGFAKLYAELYSEPDFWDACRQIWDQYVQREADRVAIVTAWATIIRYNQRLFAITPGALRRTSWKIAFDNQLRALPRRALQTGGPGRAWLGHTVVDHQSPLIQVMAGIDDWHMSFYDGIDVFVDYYFKQLPESDGLDFGTQADLREAVARRERRAVNRQQSSAETDRTESDSDNLDRDGENGQGMEDLDDDDLDE